MAYLNTTTGAYPLSAADIRAAHPNTSFPSDAVGFEDCLPDIGYAVVSATAQPVIDHTQNIAEGKPEETASGYQQTWLVTDATAAEITSRTSAQAASVRQERNQRLADCDWTQLSDAPVDAVAWATYRQALRDVTSQAGFPWQITWPSEPGAADDTVLIRARNEQGQYVGDNPETPTTDEAWVEVPLQDA